MVRQMNAVTEKAAENSMAETTKEPKRGSGATRLREAADRILSRDSQDLAEALSTSGKSGKIQSTKFLYELSDAGDERDEQEDAQKLRSIALELANAPQWTGPLPSEMDDEEDEAMAG